MFKSSKVALAIAASGVALVASVGAADARKAWRTYGQCYAAIESIATGTGILGAGTEKARASARANWEATSESLHGAGFGNLDWARDVRWDCKKGAILLAKCVVIAKPCGARTRG